MKSKAARENDIKPVGALRQVLCAVFVILCYSLLIPTLSAATVWTQVQLNGDGIGDPDNTAVTSMTSFSNLLIAGTSHLTTGQLWYYDGAAWTAIKTDGFGDANNIAMPSMAASGGYLFVGTRNEVTGAEVWLYNAGTWTQQHTDGFGDANNTATTSMIILSPYFYVGTENSNTGGEVWELYSGSWTDRTPNWGISNTAVRSMAWDGDYLYVGSENSSGCEIWRSDGSTWEQIQSGGLGDANNTAVTSMTVSGSLFVGTKNEVTGAELWMYNAGTDTWTQQNTDGFGNDNNTAVLSMAVLGSYIYVGTENSNTGAEVWRSDIAWNWKKEGNGWDGEANNTAITSMHVHSFSGTNMLCMGFSNQTTGSQVWRGKTYSAIQSAVNDSIAGSTVLVEAGTYNENVVMKQGVDVLAEDPLVRPNINGPTPVTFEGPIDNCTLDGFKLTGGGADGNLYFNGQSGAVSNVTVRNCWLLDGMIAIGIRGTVGFTLDQCDIDGSALGGIVSPGGVNGNPVLDAGSPIVIRDTHVHNAFWGSIVLNGDGQIDMVVENSFIHDNGYVGMLLNDFGSLTMDNCEVYNNGTGSSAKAGMYLKDVSSVVVTRSQIHDNLMAGIALEGTSNVTIGADLSEVDPFTYANDIYGNVRAGVQIGGDLSVPLNGNLVIRGNYLHNNGSGSMGAGIWFKAAVLSANISQNAIAQNRLGGIAIQKAPASPYNTTLVIAKNNIHDNILRGGIHTGNWAGGFANPGRFTGDSTIKQNKVHHNANVDRGGGIDVRHFAGTIKNNLVYRNARGGIRYGDYVTEISNNTVANNGNASNDTGGGIIYDDLAGAFNAPPSGVPPVPVLIRNNISAYNQKAGIRGCFDNTGEERDYNLAYANNGTGETDCGYPDRLNKRCANKNFGGCGSMWNPTPPPWVILDGPNNMITAPSFVNIDGDDYHLDIDSPAIDAGDPDPAYDDTDASRNDMGAYGGPEPIDDNDFTLPYVNCLIDGDTSTGNTLSDGRVLYCDLGSTYTVRHVRLYGSPTISYQWHVDVSTTSEGCAPGTRVFSFWNVGGVSQWYEADVTDTEGRYMRIVRQDWNDMPSDSIFEFQFTDVASPGEGDWRTPVAVVKDCTNIYGLCKQ